MNFPTCETHSEELCIMYCRQCRVPICYRCYSCWDHRHRYVMHILEHLSKMKDCIRTDLQELKYSIYPRYERVAPTVQKANVRKNSEKLSVNLKKQREALHKEIDDIFQEMQNEIENMDSKSIAFIDEQESDINHSTAKIEQRISDLTEVLNSNDFDLVFAYKSRNEEFKTMPTAYKVTLPTLTPQMINREKIHQQFGSLSELCISREEYDDETKSLGALSLSPVREELIYEPQLISEIQTDYGNQCELTGISCLHDSELWTCGTDQTIRLYNIEGGFVNRVKILYGDVTFDIAVTQCGDLVYTIPVCRSIKIVKNTQTSTLVRLRAWTPLYLCSSSTGDILVTMINDIGEAKVVRYSGSTEKQNIQWDDQGQPLYSSGNIKYISENTNLDICVADCEAQAVVVVSSAGKLRFRYTGQPSSSTTKSPSATTVQLFIPYGIATDSQGRILTADHGELCIHITDNNGQFLRFIEICGVNHPWGLCVDSRDNLYLFQRRPGSKIKKIAYEI
ncbi:uncharacterized protein LOC111109963 [Crassostrea virginica]